MRSSASYRRGAPAAVRRKGHRVPSRSRNDGNRVTTARFNQTSSIALERRQIHARGGPSASRCTVCGRGQFLESDSSSATTASHQYAFQKRMFEPFGRGTRSQRLAVRLRAGPRDVRSMSADGRTIAVERARGAALNGHMRPRSVPDGGAAQRTPGTAGALRGKHPGRRGQRIKAEIVMQRPETRRLRHARGDGRSAQAVYGSGSTRTTRSHGVRMTVRTGCRRPARSAASTARTPGRFPSPR